MADESSLFVSQVPASFEALGIKHNKVVDLLRTMTGEGNCKVTFSDNKIIIRVPSVTAGGSFVIPDPLTIGTIYASLLDTTMLYADSANIGNLSAPTFSSFYADMEKINAISITATTVYSTSITASSISATRFRGTTATFTSLTATTITSGTITATQMNATSFIGGSVSGTNFIGGAATFSSVTATTITATSYWGNSLTLTNGANTVSIGQASITRSLALKEISVCDSGTPKKILILASDPY
jgi:hypothetical protein